MRQRKALFTAFLLPFLGLSGCADPEPARQPGQAQEYFDMPAFIKEQVIRLNELQPGLAKTVWLKQEKPEIHNFKPDNWQHELEYFQETDLNKKALAGAYTVAEQKLPEGKRTVYTLKPEESAILKQVEIITDLQSQPVRVRAIHQTKNALFYSREVRDFETDKQGLFRQYRISGVQKVIFFDSLRYATQAVRSE